MAEEHPELADMRRVLVNPDIYFSSEKTSTDEEGCLSLPGIHENVSRPVAVRIRYRDENWQEHDEEYTGYPARVLQHEYDHLRGTVFTDRISPIRKTMIAGKLSSMSKGKFRASYKTRQRG
jgi:peptide deformylase